MIRRGCTMAAGLPTLAPAASWRAALLSGAMKYSTSAPPPPTPAAAAAATSAAPAAVRHASRYLTFFLATHGICLFPDWRGCRAATEVQGRAGRGRPGEARRCQGSLRTAVSEDGGKAHFFFLAGGRAPLEGEGGGSRCGADAGARRARPRGVPGLAVRADPLRERQHAGILSGRPFPRSPVAVCPHTRPVQMRAYDWTVLDSYAEFIRRSSNACKINASGVCVAATHHSTVCPPRSRWPVGTNTASRYRRPRPALSCSSHRTCTRSTARRYEHGPKEHRSPGALFHPAQSMSSSLSAARTSVLSRCVRGFHSPIHAAILPLGVRAAVQVADARDGRGVL